jgi:hypothetical protein
MSQIQWTISLVMIGLFTIAIIGFAINFAADNDSPVSLSDDPDISNLYDDSGENVVGFDTSSEDTYTSILNSSITESGSTTGGGQFALTATNTVGVVKNILKVGYTKIFGTSSGFGIFITTFLGLIVFITVLLIWKTWAGRMPD